MVVGRTERKRKVGLTNLTDGAYVRRVDAVTVLTALCLQPAAGGIR